MELQTDADLRYSLEDVGAESARIADVEVTPALFQRSDTDAVFDRAQVRCAQYSLTVLTKDLEAIELTEDAEVVIPNKGTFRISEPPTDLEGLTVLALEKV
jgi:hypothetical protein